MLRVNLTIAIVAMVIPNNSAHSNLTNVNHECSGILNNNINSSYIAKIDDNINDVNESINSIHWKVRKYFL